jgi:hypothetical protein
VLNTDGWIPIAARITITRIPELVKRLGGEQLYGRHSAIALRELLQNAGDAVRARRLLESRPEDWGTVEVALQVDQEGTWLSVADTGTGMSDRVMTAYLLDFGNSFWTSDAMSDEFPGLAAKGFGPIGTFGIGFFSTFMLGDRVRVISRRYDEAQRSTRVLAFPQGLDARPVLRAARPLEVLLDGGTIVQSLLRQNLNSGLLRRPEVSPFSDNDPGDTGWNLNRLLAWLSPAVDFNLVLRYESGNVDTVVRPSDWKTLPPELLLQRLSGPKKYSPDHPRLLALAPYFGNLRPIPKQREI